MENDITKSLKSFFRENSIRREVEGWSTKDCTNYLKKHQSDEKQSSLLKKKLKIVENVLKEKNFSQRYKSSNALEKEILKLLEEKISDLNSDAILDIFLNLTSKTSKESIGSNVKSLKSFFRENSIKREVEGWSTKDCINYLKKHESDEKQSFLLKKKLNIVQNELINKLKEFNLDKLLKTLNEYTIIKFDNLNKLFLAILCKKISVQDLQIIERLSKEKLDTLLFIDFKNTLPDFKEKLKNSMLEKFNQENLDEQLSVINNLDDFENISTDLKEKLKNSFVKNSEKEIKNCKKRREIFKQLYSKNKTSLINKLADEYAPKCIKNTSENKKKYCKHGVYLWTSGYDIEEFLGAGSFGSVWKTKNNKAIKVVEDKSEENGVSQLQTLINGEAKGDKYLNHIKVAKIQLDKNYKIFTMPLAQGDLSKPYQDNENKPPKKGKTIESVLRKARQALKAVKYMHDKGYSHNDIKPQNILKITNSKFEQAKKEYQKVENQNSKKIHKNRIQLADFGLMSKIHPDKGEKQRFGGTPKYKSPDFDNETPKAVAKRDVYALGVTFLKFLLSKYYNETAVNNIIKSFKNNGNLNLKALIEEYKIEEKYNGTSKENILNFLALIKKMLERTYNKRISIEEALSELNKIKR